MKKLYTILKVTDGCNLRCKYCYNSGTEYRNERLSLDRFEKFLRLIAAEYEAVDLTWHGGEPLTCGLEYFTEAMETEERVYRETNLEMNNSVQTNGTLINGKWADFFKKYRFGIGISYDGSDNDKYRGMGAKTLSAIKLLKKRGLKFGCMAVVPDDGYDLIENYRFFAEKNIPVAFSPLFKEGGGKQLTGLTADSYVKKSNELFDLWIYDKKGVNVKLFSAYLSMALGGDTKMCTNGSCLGKWLCICADGSLVNCGRSDIAAYSYGNIDNIEKISDAFTSDGFKQLVKDSIERRKKCKETCAYFDDCEGGCPDCALTENGLENIPDFACNSFRGIYAHVKEVTAEIVKNQTPLTELNPAVKTIVIKCLSGHKEILN